MNPDGTMEEVWLFCERKAVLARDEMARFWEHRDRATPAEGPSSLFAESTAPSPRASYEGSSRVVCDRGAKRDYLRFMGTGPSDEELGEWLLRTDVLYAEAP